MKTRKFYGGKNAVITGAASGIGKEIAVQLGEMGTNLLISDINMERLNSVKKEIEKFGVKVIAQKCDVTDINDVQKFTKLSISEFKDIHFIFSNAGMAAGGKFEWLSYENWEKIINLNIWGNIYIVSEFMKQFLVQGFGHVIVTASIAGVAGIGGEIPYSTTKFANVGFCEGLYGEFHSKGIDVSVICPFPLKTNLMETVSIGYPDDFFHGISEEKYKPALELGKKHFWEEFTKRQNIFKGGFAGGIEVKHSVKDYLKQIKKKKLYVFERRYGRFLQFLRGLSNWGYKKFVRMMGNRSMNLIHETFHIAFNSIDSETIENSRKAGNKYIKLFLDE